MISEQPEAKSPGASWCYNGICHRVKTIEQTQAIVGLTQVIETSFYDDPRFDRMNVGKLTSNGEPFDAESPGRASSSEFPDGTELLVRNPENGRTSHVRVNDFGPFYANRLLDVTKRVAQDLGFLKKGVTKLEVTVISAPTIDHANYRKNRLLPAALGFVGELNISQVRLLAERLIGDQSGNGKIATAAPAVGTQSPAQSKAASAPLTMPESAPPIPAPAVVASIAPPMHPVAPLVIVGPLTPHLEPPQFETPALELPRAAPGVEAFAPPAAAATVQDVAPGIVALADTTASDAISPHPIAPNAAGVTVSSPQAAELPEPVPGAETQPTSPKIATEGSKEVAGRGQSQTLSISLGIALHHVQEHARRLGLTLLDAWHSTADTLQAIRLESTVMMMVLISGLTSLLFYSSWMMAGMRNERRTETAAGRRDLQVERGESLALQVLAASPVKRTLAIQPPRQPIAPIHVAPIAPPKLHAHTLARTAAVSSPPRPVATSPRPVASFPVSSSPRPIATSSRPVATGAPTAAAPTSDPRASFFGPGLLIEGTLSGGASRLVIAGQVKGQISVESIEIVTGGRVDGQVKAKTVLVSGSLTGRVEATHVGIGPGGKLVGDVISETLAIDPSASIEADIRRSRA